MMDRDYYLMAVIILGCLTTIGFIGYNVLIELPQQYSDFNHDLKFAYNQGCPELRDLYGEYPQHSQEIKDALEIKGCLK